jgi:hypothetical protein
LVARRNFEAQRPEIISKHQVGVKINEFALQYVHFPSDHRLDCEIESGGGLVPLFESCLFIQ